MPVPATLRSVIFDLDGTLTDSSPGILGCLEAALRAHDVHWEGSLHWFVGPPAGESFVKLMPDRDPEFRTTVLRHYRSCYSATGWKENAVYPGIPKLLTRLNEHGIALYLCTSKLEIFTRRILDHFELTSYFAGIAADPGTSEHHDKADLLTELMERHIIDPSTAVMVGDRKFDVLAAHAKEIAAIAVLYGFGSAAELTATQPEATCATVAELGGFLLARDSPSGQK